VSTLVYSPSDERLTMTNSNYTVIR